MRKKIMATILGTAMLLTAVSFTGCGKSVKDSTSAKTEKTTKETKRDEKIEIKILSKYDQIKKLLSKYPKEMTAEDTSYQGIVVIEYDSFGKGSKKLWNQFLKNVNGKFYYVEDSTRDAYGSEKYVQYTYDYYKIYKQDGHYTAILTMDNKLTFDEAQDVRSLKTAIQLLDEDMQSV